MQYLMLIYDAEASWAKMTAADQAAMYKEYGQFTQQIMESGNHQAGHQLKPIATATTVRIRDGKRVVTDGPFAETKDLDEAISIAARIPSVRHGSIEIRPIVTRGETAEGKVA
jgi:hypothetical protein